MVPKFVLLLFFSFSFNFASSVRIFSKYEPQFFEVSKTQVQQIRENFGKLFWDYLQEGDKKFEPQISSECSKELKSAAFSSSREEWKSKLRSLSGQFPKNFDKGTLIDFGKYDQCLATNFPIATHYCMASFIPREEWLEKSQQISSRGNPFSNIEFIPGIGLTLKVGLCVPAKCSSTDVSLIHDYALNTSQWEQVEECRCQGLNNSGREREFTKLQYLSIFVIGSLIFLVIRAGLRDIRSMISYSNDEPDFLHSCFSPRANLIDLFIKSDEARWKMMDQLRLFSYQIVFIAHIMLWPPFFAPSIIDKFDDTKKFVNQLWTQPLINNYFFEGLIGLGGISSAISIWVKIDRNTTFLQCLRMIFSRFIMTQPIILATIFLEVTVSSFLKGPGPSVFIETPYQACEKNLIHHILHIKTFLGKNIMCAPHFWSLSAEFHLFTLAVFLIFLYHRHKTLSKLIMTILTIGGLAYTMSVFYQLNLTPLFLVYPFKFSDGFVYTMNNYLTTSTHLWIHVGNVLFFVLMMEKFDEKFTLKQRSLLMWVARGLIVLCCFSLAIFNVQSIAPTALSSAIFIGLVYSGLMFYLFCDICCNAKDGREMVSEKMVKRKTNTNHLDNHTNSSVDVNSNDEKRPQKRRASLLQIFLRLSKIAYFPSTIVIFTFYATAKEPIDLISSQQVKNIFVIYACILGAAPIFHILVTGPYLKLVYWPRAGPSSKTEKLRMD